MKILISTLLLFIVTISMVACKKLIEVGPPNDKIVTENVFSRDESAISAMTSIYARMNREGSPSFYIPLLTGLYCDELKNYSTTVQLVTAYTNSLNPVDLLVPNIWGIAYNHIYQANAVFEGCEQSNLLSGPVKKQLMAEARFVRAFWYFYITNLFGDVPLVLHTDYSTSSVSSKVSQLLIYDQIIADLQYSEANLSSTYVAGNSVGVSSERLRPNVDVAKALLSRVYLYRKEYANAELKATEVIEKPIYKLEILKSVFLKTSKEVIWQIQTPTSSTGVIGATPEGTNFILTAKPLSSSVRCATISDRLLNQFEVGDQRRINWIGEYKDNGVTPAASYYFSYKYKVNASGAEQSEYTTPFRLAEQYLIRAEARANLDKLPLAIADLDSLRKRSGLPLISITHPGIGKGNLLNVILHERQVELFCEWGHRFFDLKRTDNIDQIMNQVSISKGGTWSSYKAKWPIPFFDIQNNPKLIQNFGYQ